VADWVTISSLGTAGGTLVLAVATFSSVRSANRSARVAELSLLTGLRPVLTPSREDDPQERVRFGDRQVLNVPGHGANIARTQEAIYLALSLRNGGAGLAVIHGWRVSLRPAGVTGQTLERPDLEDFHRQMIDLYIPASATGYWLGALRDPSDSVFRELSQLEGDEQIVQIDLLYGDHEGGQRAIVRFALARLSDDEPGKRATVVRYWNVDRQDPR
jgi:hypothetical protein